MRCGDGIRVITCKPGLINIVCSIVLNYRDLGSDWQVPGHCLLFTFKSEIMHGISHDDIKKITRTICQTSVNCVPYISSHVMMLFQTLRGR